MSASRGGVICEREVKRVPLARALRTAQRHDYLDAYVADLPNVVDLHAIRAEGIEPVSPTPIPPAIRNSDPISLARPESGGVALEGVILHIMRLSNLTW